MKKFSKFILKNFFYILNSFCGFFNLLYLLVKGKIQKKQIIFFELYTSRIGHTVYNSECFFNWAKLNASRNRLLIVLSFQKTANKFVLRTLSTQLNFNFIFFIPFFFKFIKKFLKKYVSETNNLYPDFAKVVCHPHLYSSLPSPIKFDKHLESLNNKSKNNFKIFKNEYVSIHNRDNKYLSSKENNDLNFHDYRNYEIDDLYLVSNFLHKKNIKIIRHGEKQNPCCKKEMISKIIDLTNKKLNQNTDFLLLKDCKFFIGCSTGFTMIPVLHRKPMLLVNYMPWIFYEICIYTPNSLIMPKLIYDEKRKRYLKFKEIANIKFDIHSKICPYKSKGYKVIKNTPKEILDAGKQIYNSVEGKYKQDNRAKYLQEKLWESLKGIKGVSETKKLNINIPDSFLKKYHNLI